MAARKKSIMRPARAARILKERRDKIAFAEKVREALIFLLTKKFKTGD